MENKKKSHLNKSELEKLSKKELIKVILKLQEMNDLQEEQLQTLKKKQEELEDKARNLKVNQPTSKQPEWDKNGDHIKKADPKKRKKRRKKRPGCGNKSKVTLIPDETILVELHTCPECSNDLSQSKGKANHSRIIEDIAPPAEKTIVVEEITESKWCHHCKKTVSSKSEKALPGSDIGLNASIEMIYLWVMCSLSLPNIQNLLNVFKAFKISSAGISKMMIRISNIMQPVYKEILEDVKNGLIIWADETGWRTQGKLNWLWVFANKRSVFYWPDEKRTGSVVEKILGPYFLGVLIADAYGAYNIIECLKQTCMPHIYRKIRAFIIDNPNLRSVLSFYIKLRQIVRDGEKLQAKRSQIKEETFQKNVELLKNRLEKLLAWKKPNPVLKKIIKKVKKQQDKILTFVLHPNVESHNNYSEYLVKKGIIKRKISGGSKSQEGFSAYACLQSIAMTCHLRKVSFSKFMLASLTKAIRTGKPMLLSEYEASILKIESNAA